jgi:hypothetical protein
MSRPLTNPEMVQLQIDTDYLDAGIPVGGSMVVFWMNKYVLIYHGTAGYFPTDISSLPASTITELSKQTPQHGILYYLPSSVQSVVSNAAETVINAGGTVAQVANNVAQTIGQTIASALNPVVVSLTLPLLVVGVIAIAYLYTLKKI